MPLGTMRKPQQLQVPCNIIIIVIKNDSSATNGNKSSKTLQLLQEPFLLNRVFLNEAGGYPS